MTKNSIADLVRRRFKWTDQTKLLDFGCGVHGSLATELCDLALHTLAADSNPEAVNSFKQRCERQGLHEDEVSAVCDTELFTDVRWQQYFDLAVASLVWHHVSQSERPRVAEQLRNVLKPGGSLFIIDLDALDSSGSRLDINGVTKHELHLCLSNAKYSNIRIESGPKITLKSGKKAKLIIAEGTNSGAQ